MIETNGSTHSPVDFRSDDHERGEAVGVPLLQIGHDYGAESARVDCDCLQCVSMNRFAAFSDTRTLKNYIRLTGTDFIFMPGNKMNDS